MTALTLPATRPPDPSYTTLQDATREPLPQIIEFLVGCSKPERLNVDSDPIARGRHMRDHHRAPVLDGIRTAMLRPD